jgi:DNA-binding MarR family transcriptional regulator
MNAEEFSGLRALLERIVNKYTKLERIPLDFGTGEALLPSELHILEAIGDGAAETVTGIADRLGITKGAVSQIVARLDARGYLIRRRNAHFGKEILTTLSDKGMTAYAGHGELHRRIDSKFQRRLAEAPVGELDAAARMLVILERHLDSWIKELSQ